MHEVEPLLSKSKQRVESEKTEYLKLFFNFFLESKNLLDRDAETDHKGSDISSTVFGLCESDIGRITKWFLGYEHLYF